MSHWTAINHPANTRHSAGSAALSVNMDIKYSSNENQNRMSFGSNVELLDIDTLQAREHDENVPQMLPARASKSASSSSSQAPTHYPAAAPRNPVTADTSCTLDFRQYFTVGQLDLQSVFEGKKWAKFGQDQIKTIVQWMVESERYSVCYHGKQDNIDFEVDFNSLIEFLGFDNPEFPDIMRRRLSDMVKSKILRLRKKMKENGALVPVIFANGVVLRGRFTWANFTQAWTAEDWDGRMV